MRVLVNGEATELVEGATVQVAVDQEVVPRGQWAKTQLHEGARVEILRAIQGG